MNNNTLAKCGELGVYEGGHCGACGLLQPECPAYSGGTQVELMTFDSEGVNRVFHTLMAELPLEDAVAVMREFWLTQPTTSAVRFNGQGREAILRRPVDAYGPGKLPSYSVASTLPLAGL